MYGLVPRPIWAKRTPPDDRNRIPQNANVLLIEAEDGRLGLVDSGCGDAQLFDERERQLHGLGPGWPLLDALHARGIEPEQISFIAFTHLHWDHASGAASFPNAEIYVHEYEWEDALSGNVLLYKSYPAAVQKVFRAVDPARLRLRSDRDAGVIPGFRLLRSSGHTRGHAAAVFEGSGIELCGAPGEWSRPSLAVFAGDVCPTQHHLRMVFQTSYDTYPLDTRAWKLHWLSRLARERGMLIFDHDAEIFGATISADERAEFVVTERWSIPA